jgi:hypothetical protein
MSSAIRRAASTVAGSITSGIGKHTVQRMLAVHSPVIRQSYRSLSILSTRHRVHQTVNQLVRYVRLTTTNGMATISESKYEL